MTDNKLSDDHKKILLEHLKNTILTINDLGYQVNLSYARQDENDNFTFDVDDLELVDM